MSATRAGFRGDRWTNRRDEAVSLAAGVVFTVALLAVMAHFGRRTTMAPPVEIADLRVMTVPLEPPPPVVETPREPVETGMPLVGIEVGASDSPVRIAVVPPDLESLVPISAAPTATIQPLQL
ncbi:MAG TPA: hypothetical protein VHE13_03190 [Opitutus sp.]|nr:hypothetical protein [Opitutus sp.]